MKKRIKKLFIAVLTICLLLQLFPATAFAASVSVSASSSTVKVGSTVKVTVTFKGTNIGAVQAKFSYDSSILSYQGGTPNEVSDGKIVKVGSGVSSLSVYINFKALKEGSSKVSVSTVAFYDINEVPLGAVSGSKTITVSNTTTSTPKPTTKPTIEPTPSGTPEQGIPVVVGQDTYYLWRSLNDAKLPEDFGKAAYIYKGTEIEAAKSESKNMLLLYLTDQDRKNGSFYVYNEAADSLYQFIDLDVISEKYIVLQPGDPAAVPEGYAPTQLLWGERSVQAWQNSAEEFKEFYLLYAMNSKGTTAFYLYDSAEGTMQRYIEAAPLPTPTPSPTPTPTPTPTSTPVPTATQEVSAQPVEEQDFFQKVVAACTRLWDKIRGDDDTFYVFAGLSGLCLLLLVILILQGIKKKKLKKRIRLSEKPSNNGADGEEAEMEYSSTEDMPDEAEGTAESEEEMISGAKPEESSEGGNEAEDTKTAELEEPAVTQEAPTDSDDAPATEEKEGE
ncbi:MAG: cohesin domain-containing protein [Christensenellales bacterium]